MPDAEIIPFPKGRQLSVEELYEHPVALCWVCLERERSYEPKACGMCAECALRLA